MTSDITVLLAGRLPTFPIRRRGQLKVGSMLKLKQFVSVIIRQRDGITSAIREDRQAEVIQRRVLFFPESDFARDIDQRSHLIRDRLLEHRKGHYAEGDEGEIFDPLGKTKTLVIEYRQKINGLYQQARIEARDLPSAPYLLSKLEAAYRGHGDLLDRAESCVDTGEDYSETFETHCQLVSDLASLIQQPMRVEIDPQEMLTIPAIMKKFKVPKRDQERLRKRLDSWRGLKRNFGSRDWSEVENRQGNDPKYFYRLGAVWDKIKDLCSAVSPAKKN